MDRCHRFGLSELLDEHCSDVRHLLPSVAYDLFPDDLAREKPLGLIGVGLRGKILRTFRQQLNHGLQEFFQS